ncbi:MAG: type II toxin-antitoxin system VapC family toxin [Spartobacteria bacterium]|nr:type II toxin-antitoxin system VapC family toxin [Spartobacteria bacterium]
MNLLLDTCALLWLASGDVKLTQNARNSINEAGVVFVSVISGFEVALKVRRGKLVLPAEPDEWLSTIVNHHGLEMIPLHINDAMKAALLPDIHRDPCDRFILAQAMRLDVAVVTGDHVFSDYGVKIIR